MSALVSFMEDVFLSVILPFVETLFSLYIAPSISVGAVMLFVAFVLIVAGYLWPN